MSIQSITEQQDPALEDALTWLQEAGLLGPAYLLLRGVQPMTFLFGQGLLFLQPLLPRQRWRQAAGRWAEILADRARLEVFLTALETHLYDCVDKQEEERV